MKTTGWDGGQGEGRVLEGSWIWLSVYPCLRTSWRHKCQLWAVCGLPTKLLACFDPDWFYLLDSWHATYKPWPSMCHSNAMASQPPLTSVLMDIRVSILHSRLSAVVTVFSLFFLISRWVAFKWSLFAHICIYQTLLSCIVGTNVELEIQITDENPEVTIMWSRNQITR